jgi:hypothetical protein
LEMGGLTNSYLGWSWMVILLISASQVVRIAGIIH